MERKNKICHIITRPVRGGAQLILLSIVKEQLKRGYCATIIAGLETGPEGSMVEEFQKSGARVIFVKELKRKESLINDIKALFKIYDTISKNRYDIVHTHTSKAGVIGRIAGKLAGVPCIVHSSHGHIFGQEANIPDVSDRPFMKKLFFYTEKFASYFCDRVITLTEIEKQELVEMRLADKKKFFALPNAIQIELYTKHPFETNVAKKELGLSENDVVICSIGRLTAEKGHSFLLEGVKNVANNKNNFKVLIVGDGPLRDNLKAKASELKIQDKVLFLGFRDDIIRILSATDIYVHPSRYEGFGLVMLEAMILKKPVIATKVGGIPDIIEDGFNGFLVQPDNHNELAEKIIMLANDKELSKSIGERAYNIVTNKYSFEKMMERLEGLYESILEKNRKCFWD